jgi:hypothetical protein
MNSRLSVAVLLCIAGIAGCQSKKPPTAQTSGAPNPALVNAAEPAATTPTESSTPVVHEPPKSAHATTPQDEANASRDAVASRAKQYAREMERATASRAETPKPQTSKVDWTDIFQETTSDADQGKPSAQPPTVSKTTESSAPVVETKLVAVKPPVTVPHETPSLSANTKVSLDGSVDDAGVMSVPEGQEFATVAPTTAPPVAPAPVAKPKVTPQDASLSDQLAKRIKENPRDVAAHLDYQLYQFATGQSVPQLQPLASLPGEDREVIAAVMDGLSNFRTSVQADENQLLSKKIRPLVELSDRLRAQADLSLPSVVLCKKVTGYGVYEPIDPAAFPRGRETQAILYTEVTNFNSQKTDNVQWRTSLAHSATLYKDSGVPVWSDKTTEVFDNSRNRRHDFFVVKMVKLPSSLPSGNYVMKVTVVDRQTNRMAEASTPLTIVGDGDGMAKTE